MSTIPAILAMLCAAIFSLTAPSHAQSPPAASPKYRLDRQRIAGMEPRQWVWVLTAPNGYSAVVASNHLQRYIGLAVPQGSTLEWEPGCDVIGGEPMGSAAEVEAFAAFCRQRRISFVRVPSG